MLSWLKSLFKVPQPAGPPEAIKTFTSSDATITQDGITIEDEGWRIECKAGKSTVALFEIPDPDLEQCIVTYRARMKGASVTGGAYLEMWCRFPGRGEFFSKGLHNKIKGTMDWASYEIPFFLKKGQRPDLIKLNLTLEGEGTVWLKDVELLKTRLV